jgi:hypothetical protein
MQGSAWIQLLRLLPAALHNNILLTTANGCEIAVQTLVRAEADYLVVRGRLTGTIDGGDYFFIPYAQINFLGFQRAVDPSTLGSLVEGDGTLTSPPPAPPAAVAAPEPAVTSAGDPPAEPTPAPTPLPKLAPGGASKLELLERLRAQRANQGTGFTPTM